MILSITYRYFADKSDNLALSTLTALTGLAVLRVKR